MKRLLVLVEGQTEEAFVAEVLAPHLSIRGVLPVPTILKGRTASSASMRGQSLGDFQKTRNAPGAVYSVSGRDGAGSPR